MRITKNADERKNEILDAAHQLFVQKGFDKATISDIIEKVGIARGTIYYHFKSKEEILDALIQRQGMELLDAAQKIATDKNIPVMQRFFQTLMALNGNQGELTALTKEMHKPQNALMHQKTHQIMLEEIPPILMEIISDGIKEGLFDTPYPYESLEMIIIYVNTAFDDYADTLSNEDLQQKIQALIFNIEKLLGAKEGSFHDITDLF